MTSAEKKKVTVAFVLMALALIVVVWRVFLSGDAGPSRAEMAAQEKVLEQMKQEAPVPEDAPVAAPASGEPAGKPRSVRPGN